MGIILGIESTAHTFSFGGVLEDGETISASSALFRPEKGGIHPREAADHHSIISGDKFREFISHNNLDTKDIDALSILDGEKILNISKLSSLIKGSSFVIANDTGPAHIAAHVNAKGLTLFGKHTTAYKVSIERDNFKAIQVNDLINLSADKVFERLTNSLS